MSYMKTYFARFIDKQTGGLIVNERPFTQIHADAEHSALGPDGIPYAVAQRLISTWNRSARLYHGEDRFSLTNTSNLL